MGDKAEYLSIQRTKEIGERDRDRNRDTESHVL